MSSGSKTLLPNFIFIVLDQTFSWTGLARDEVHAELICDSIEIADVPLNQCNWTKSLRIYSSNYFPINLQVTLKCLFKHITLSESKKSEK
jgi:hypothetical protein